MVGKFTEMKLLILGKYLSNYSAEYHVRELARLVKKSHVGLLPHLHSLVEDKILVFQKKGKNKVFSLNSSNVITRDFLVLAEILGSIEYLTRVFVIKKIKAEILKLSLQGTIVLFGSYAKKTQTEESDIDLFYLGTLTRAELEQIRNIGRIYGKIINVKVSTLKNFEGALRKKDALIKEIIKNHFILQNAELFVNALWGYYGEIKQ